MNKKLKVGVILIFKILAVIFLLSAIGSFFAAIIFNVKNNTENIVFYIFTNLIVTLFYRLALALFFFVFAMFVDEWLKIDEKE